MSSKRQKSIDGTGFVTGLILIIRPSLRRDKVPVPHLAEDGYVVSAQNGLNERLIGARIGRHRTLGCFVNFGADWIEPGLILYANRAAVALGELDGSNSASLQDMYSLFSLVDAGARMAALDIDEIGLSHLADLPGVTCHAVRAGSSRSHPVPD